MAHPRLHVCDDLVEPVRLLEVESVSAFAAVHLDIAQQRADPLGLLITCRGLQASYRGLTWIWAVGALIA